jgi:hypothetical protein
MLSLGLPGVAAYSAATSCTSADDSIWTAKGSAAFDADMNQCGKSCLGQAACVKTCIEKQEGYSDACSQCFGDLGGCTASNCWAKCIGGETDSCKTCVKDKCDASFTACSGFTPPAKVLGASTCAGTADPPFKGDAICWLGQATVFGQKEVVLVKLNKFRADTGDFNVDVEAGGVSPAHCESRDGVKKGQDLDIDMNGCAKALTINEAKYCSDTDSIDITVTDIVTISATLARTDPCPT